MYEIIKLVIENGRFELRDILKKIDTVWIQGDITEDQKNDLVDLARKNAVPENSYASIMEQIDKLFELYKKLEAKLQETPSDDPETKPENIIEEYPEYKQPLGAHDAYKNGDKVTYFGVRYVCTAPEGVAVVWNPEVYPPYWTRVE